MNTKPPERTSSARPPQDRAQERYLPGDPIPVPEAVEANTESNWALFSEVPREPEPEFLDTVPAAMLDEKLAAPLRKRTE